MAYKFGYDDENIYVEQGTDRVPDDDQFYIVLRGQPVEAHLNAKRALARLQQLLHNLPEDGEFEAPDAKTQMMQAEMVHRFLRQSSNEKRANRTRKGGKGRA